MKKIIYIIDDEPDICQIIATQLNQHGYETRTFQTGQQALNAIQRKKPDVCIIDLGLPDMDGTALVKEFCDKPGMGVIIISGRGSTTDRILGLEFGADDYLAKPFEPRELVARVNSLFRRLEQINQLHQASNKDRKAIFADWLFDPNTLTLHHQIDSINCELSSAEAALLSRLLQAPRQILSRDQLMQTFADPFDRSIDVRMSRLRKKVETDPKHPSLIKTVYGAGYILTCEVSWQA
jgi:two-component system OmpR family response regulator